MNGVVIALVIGVVALAVIGPYAVRWPGRPEWMSTAYGWFFLAFIALVALSVLLPLGLFTH